ncbi:MAG: NAD-dependent epimerase/dehydratase family protein [Lentisphaeraceae bacterium]|nr:NAD-dependent epimerase/dehydratase family protein [Lentisphaeraceae bacterium]
MKKILVTGGAGFVGSNLAIGLKEHFQDCEVLVLDNLMRRGSELNLIRLKENGIGFVHGDVRIPSDLEAVGSVDFLIECSAEPSVLAGADGNPNYVVQTNLNGAINCAEFCRKHNAGMVFLSTSRVYSIGDLCNADIKTGETRYELTDNQSVSGISSKGITEDFSTKGFKSFYGASKFAAEVVLEEYRQMFKWPIIINRCGLIAGPWQFGKADQGIVSFWIQAHLSGRNLKYIGFDGLGKQVRDVIHIKDLTRLVIEQLQSPDKFSKDVFNVGGGLESSFSLQELTGLCQDVTGCKIDITAEKKERYADIPVFITDCHKISAHSKWKIELNVEDVVQDVYNWLQNNRSVCSL